jgi:hypothetical protein
LEVLHFVEEEGGLLDSLGDGYPELILNGGFEVWGEGAHLGADDLILAEGGDERAGVGWLVVVTDDEGGEAFDPVILFIGLA